MKVEKKGPSTKTCQFAHSIQAEKNAFFSSIFLTFSKLQKKLWKLNELSSQCDNWISEFIFLSQQRITNKKIHRKAQISAPSIFSFSLPLSLSLSLSLPLPFTFCASLIPYLSFPLSSPPLKHVEHTFQIYLFRNKRMGNKINIFHFSCKKRLFLFIFSIYFYF